MNKEINQLTTKELEEMLARNSQFGQSFQNVGLALTFNVSPKFTYHETLESFIAARR